MYFREAQAALLIFDKTNPKSLENLKEWIVELDSKADISKMVIAIAMNKYDLPDQLVPEEDVEEFVEAGNYMLFRTSAKTGEGVQDMFTQVAKQLYARSRNGTLAGSKPSKGDPGGRQYNNVIN